MIRTTTTEELRDRMEHFDGDDYALFTYDRIVYADDVELAIEMYLSDGIFAMTGFDHWSGKSIPDEILLGYKKVSFPVDIYNLYYTHNFLTTYEPLAVGAEIFIEDFMLLFRDTLSFSGQFEGYYRFCPELVDDFRLGILNELSSIRRFQIKHEFEEAIHISLDLKENLNSFLLNHVTNDLPSESGCLDLSKYNPVPTTAEQENS